MQQFIAPKNADVIDVKGVIHTDLDKNTLLSTGDKVQQGMLLILPKESAITLVYEDGSEEVVSGNSITDESVDIQIADETIALEPTDDLLDDINAIQDLIESGDDVELPDTAAGGVLNNAGTSFVTLDRDAEELLAQARYDTTEPANTAAIILNNDPDPLNEASDLTFTQNDQITIDEDQVAQGNVLDNDIDANDDLTVQSFTISGDATDYLSGQTAEVEGGSLTINSDGSFIFTPLSNWNGELPLITYTTNTDATGTLSITVTPVSDLIDDGETLSVNEDTPTSGNVLDNASSPDGPITITSVVIGGVEVGVDATTQLDEGAFTLNEDGSYTFVPADNFNGDLPEISYTVTDAAGDTQTSTLAISVTPESDLTDDGETISVQEDTPTSGNVLDNASSPDGPLTITSVVIGGVEVAVGATTQLDEGAFTLNEDGSYTFVPADNFNGDLPEISYTVTDGAGDTQTSTLAISVTPVSDLTDDGETISIQEDTPTSGNVLDNASSPDGPLIITSVVIGGVEVVVGATTQLDEGDFTLNEDGSYTFVPADNFNGDLPEISYTVTDGAGDTQTSTIAISVTPVSDLTDDSETISVQEDTPTSGNVLDNASSPDGPITITSVVIGGVEVVVGATTQLDEGAFTLNEDGSYTFVPADNFNGDLPEISYTVTDAAGDTQTSTLAISVTPESDLTDDGETISVQEDTPTSGNVLDNASSPDGPLTITSVVIGGVEVAVGATTQLDEGAFTLNEDGSYTFVPADNFNGDLPEISYTVTDGAGDTQTSTLAISVTPVSDLTDDGETISIQEDTPTSGNVLDNASSPDGPLIITSVVIGGVEVVVGATTQLDEGDFTLNEDGSYTFVPADNFNGDLPEISYTVTDAAGDTQTSTIAISVTPVSDLTDDSETISVQEDTPTSGNVLDNASSPDGPLTITSVVIGGVEVAVGATTQLDEGAFTLNEDGSYTFVPADNFNGDLPEISYTVTDAAGDTQTSTLAISVTPESDLTDDGETISVQEDTPTSGNVLDNASSPDGPLTITSVVIGGVEVVVGATTQLDEGDFTLNEDGSYTFIPADNFNGDLPEISYTVTDGAGDTQTSTLTITVEPVNDAPTAVNDNYSVDEGQTVSGNVINDTTGGAADSDVDGDPLTITQVNGIDLVFGADGFADVAVEGGTLHINAAGDFEYTNTGFEPGDDAPTFDYTLSDGSDISTASVSITVTDVPVIIPNTAPTAVNDNYSVDEGQTVSGNMINDTTGGAADSDVDGDPLTVTQVNGIDLVFGADGFADVAVEGGTLRIKAAGEFEYTNTGFEPGDAVPTFDYTLSDGEDTSTATVTIAVTDVPVIIPNTAPTAVNDNYSVDEGQTVSGNAINDTTGGAADSDVDGDPLTVTQVNGIDLVFGADGFADVAVEGGTLRIKAAGDFEYTNTGFEPGDAVPTFDYTLSDGEDTSTATVTIAVTDVPVIIPNTAPTAVNDNYSVDEGQTVSGNVINDTTGGAADSDVDGDPLTITQVNGIDLVFGADGFADVAVEGGTLHINAAGDFEYTNTGFEPGDDAPTFDYTLSDGSDISTASVSITVTDVPVIIPNTAPTAVNDNYSVDEGQTVSGNMINDTTGGAADSDVDGDPLTVTQVNGIDLVFGADGFADVAVEGGTLRINAAGEFEYTNTGFEPGDDAPTFDYTLSDGEATSTATVTIAVTDVPVIIPNTAPTAVNDNYSVDEGQTVSGNVINDTTGGAADSDVDGDPLTITQVNGIDLVFGADGFADVAVEGGTLRINAAGDFEYTNTGFEPGDDAPTFDYTLSDGEDTSTATVTIAVTDVPVIIPNTAPTAVNDNYSVDEGQTVSGNVINDTTGGTADSDVDGDPLTITQVNGIDLVFGADGFADVAVEGGTLRINAAGDFEYTNTGFEPGDAVPTFDYTLSDGEDTSTATVTIAVTDVPVIIPNTAPTAVNDNYSVDEGQTVSGNAINDTTGGAADSDVDGDPLTVTQVNGIDLVFGADGFADVAVEGGTLRINAAGDFEYTNTGFEPGDDAPTFDYTLSDGEDTSTATVTIAVTDVPVIIPNTAPTAVNDNYSVDEGQTVSGNVINDTTGGTADSDVDGDPLTITQVNGIDLVFGADGFADVAVEGGTLRINAAGDFEYTNTGFEPGDAVPTFDYTLSDGEDTSTATVTIAVTDVPVIIPNTAPTAVNDNYSVDEGQTVSGNAINDTTGGAADSDVDGDPLTVTQVNGIDLVFGADGFADVAVEGGTLRINAAGDFEYTNTGFEPGDAVPTFDYTLSDGEDTSTATVTIAVTDVPVIIPNTAPTAVNDNYSVDEGQTVSGNAINDTTGGAADSDVDGDPLTITQVNGIDLVFGADGFADVAVEGGTLRINAAGDFEYTNTGFEPGDAVPTFDYTLSDGEDTSTATVTIAVTDVPVIIPNTAPTAVNDNYSVDEGQTVSGNVINDTTGGTADSDVDGDPLTITQVNGIDLVFGADGFADVAVEGGTLRINAAGDFEYTNTGFEPGDAVPTFDYTLSDGEDTSTATVTIAVTDVPVIIPNTAPTAVNDNYSVDEGQTVSGNAINDTTGGAADSDVDGDPLTVTQVNGIDLVFGADGFADVAVEGGTLRINAAGDFEYTNTGFEPGDAVPTFDYTLSDGEDTSTATVTIAVTDVPVIIPNTAPTAVNDNYSVDEGQTVSGNAINDTTGGAADSDVDGDPLTITQVNGIDLVFGADGFADVAVEGGTLRINAAGDFEYTNTGFEPGDAVPTFDYTLSDGEDTSTATVTIAVTDVPVIIPNTAPTAVNDNYSVDEGQTVSGNVINDTTGGTADSDVDGDPLTITQVNGIDLVFGADGFADVAVEGGTLRINVAGDFEYTNTGFEPGDDAPTFDYTLSDGEATSTATVTIAVTDVPVIIPNTAPTAVNDNYSVDEGQTVSGNVINDTTGGTADSDVDGDPLTITQVNGIDLVFGADGFADVAVEGGTLRINAAGDFEYTNTGFEPGDAVPTFDYTLSDGEDTSTATVTIAVTDVPVIIPNTAPTAVNDNYSVDEGQTVSGNAINDTTGGAADSDVDGDPLTVTQVNGIDLVFGADGFADVAVEGGTLRINAAGEFEYTNTGFEPGDDAPTFDYTLSDGEDTSTATVTIAVTDVPVIIPNTAPTAVNDNYSVDEGQTVSGNVINDTTGGAADSDVDGDPLTITQVNGIDLVFGADGFADVAVEGGTLRINAAGEFEYTNTGFEPGDDAPTFDYTLSDGEDTSTATVTIAVTDVPVIIPNTAPTAVNDNYSVDEGQTVSGNVINDTTGGAADSDVDGDPLTITQVNGIDLVFGADGFADVAVEGGTLRINAAGDFEYTNTGFEPGDDAPTFDYTLSDGEDTSTATVTIAVTDVPVIIPNTAPIATDDNFSVNEGETVSGNVISHDDGDGVIDSDADNDTLTITQVNGIDLVFDDNVDSGFVSVDINGDTLRINAQGEFSYTNTGSEPGDTTPSFEYTLSDGEDTSTATATISVIDTAPIANDDNNYISLIQNDNGDIPTSKVGGSIILSGSSGDNKDISADGVINLISISHNGDEYVFNDTDTSFVITTEYGSLTIDDTGIYSYTSNPDIEMPVGGGVSDVFTYTIQDGDINNPEIDTADLTIYLTPGLNDANETTKDTTGNVLDNAFSYGLTWPDNMSYELDLSVKEFRVNGVLYKAGQTAELTEGDFTLNSDGSFIFEPTDGFSGEVPDVIYKVTDSDYASNTSTLTIDTSVPSSTPVKDDGSFDTSTIDTSLIKSSLVASSEFSQTAVNDEQPDLSDLLSDDANNSLDDYLAFDEVEGATALNDGFIAGENDALNDETVELVTIESDDTSQQVTNGLLADGAIIVSDAAAPSAPTLAEMDSTDIL
ncbi:Ig-like domain-containing protein [Pseudocolwellia sp. HL-MZ7]|uniref:Ig-like domain-containing protein n=1 Tax=Pseudocolwellia sp. HL-MZ7 TaxID=3400627 RepID=UPI003CFA4C79